MSFVRGTLQPLMKYRVFFLLVADTLVVCMGISADVDHRSANQRVSTGSVIASYRNQAAPVDEDKEPSHTDAVQETGHRRPACVRSIMSALHASTASMHSSAFTPHAMQLNMNVTRRSRTNPACLHMGMVAMMQKCR